MSAETIYNFEVLVPEACKTVLVAAGLTAITLADAQALQKTRPRVEIVYKHLGETTPKRLAILPDGSKRTSCFRGELKLHAITDADVAGKTAHSAYRAAIRNVLATLEQTLNGTVLTQHKIQFVVSGIEETGVRAADGYEQTTFPFTIDISIQQDAWATLGS
jgi:hypothetical protein